MYASNSHSYTHLILALGIVREPTVWGFITSKYPGIHDIGLPKESSAYPGVDDNLVVLVPMLLQRHVRHRHPHQRPALLAQRLPLRIPYPPTLTRSLTILTHTHD